MCQRCVNEAVGDSSCLPLSLSSGLVGPGLSSASTAAEVVARPATSSSRLGASVVPATSSSARVGGSAPTVAATTEGVTCSLGLWATLCAMAVLGAVGALDTAPVLGLRALAAHVTLGVAVAAALDTRLGAVRDVVTRLETVEASSASATASARLEGLRAVSLAVTIRQSVRSFQ